MFSIRVLNKIELNIFLAEVVQSKESTIKHLRCSLQCCEGDVEQVGRAEHHQVPHLAAVGPYLLCQVVRAIVDCHPVKRTVSASIKEIKVTELQANSLSRFTNKLVAAFNILRVGSWVGG